MGEGRVSIPAHPAAVPRGRNPVAGAGPAERPESSRYARTVTDQRAPDAIFELALARAQARRDRDWAAADRLKADIEAAGWRVVDQGSHFRLQPAVPPDVVEDGVVRYGSSVSVPSRLAEPSTPGTTFVVLPRGLDDRTDEVAARALASAGPEAMAVAVIPPEAGGVGEPHDARLEILRAAVPLAPGAAANAGFRRAVGEVVVLLQGGSVVTGDIASTLGHALEDPTVAVAGAHGSVTADLRHHDAVGPGDDADVILPPCIAFRREDGIGRGPFDERFLTSEGLFTWWSLVLRDGGEGTQPRRAVVVAGLPLEPDGAAVADGDVSERSTRRDFYRLLERFGSRPGLTRGGAVDPSA